MNNQENDQQHQHQEDGQEEVEQEQEKVAEKEQEKPEAEKEQEKPEAAEDQEKLEESEEQEKLEEADNHIMQSSSSTNSQSPPFGSPQLSTIASNHQAYSLNHPQAFKPPKPSSPPLSGTAVEENTNIGISKTQDREVVDEKNDPESGGGGGERRLRTNLSILRRVRRENMKRRALLGFRICGFLFSLVSFSIMAADKNQGWALDSFNRYKEFRYCMAVNVLGFVYSSLQGYDVAYSLAVGKHAVRTQLRCFLDFSIDQILTYLLLSASSSAAFRIEDWESNWGKDEFPTMAKASVALSFLAFVAFAFCSLVSGYTLFTPNST